MILLLNIMGKLIPNIAEDELVITRVTISPTTIITQSFNIQLYAKSYPPHSNIVVLICSTNPLHMKIIILSLANIQKKHETKSIEMRKTKKMNSIFHRHCCWMSLIEIKKLEIYNHRDSATVYRMCFVLLIILKL